MEYGRWSFDHTAESNCFDFFIPALFVNVKYFTFSYTFCLICMIGKILLQKEVQTLSTINVITLVWTEAPSFRQQANL